MIIGQSLHHTGAPRRISYLNSEDHDTSITFVAAGKSVVLSPGFLNDHNPEFRWIPFETKEVIPCVLCVHSSDKRRPVRDLVKMIIGYYQGKEDL